MTVLRPKRPRLRLDPDAYQVLHRAVLERDRWRCQVCGGGSGKPGERSMAELTAENARLRKELAEARMEREILKKATAYFAKESLPGTRS
jgi:transposase-like protein